MNDPDQDLRQALTDAVSDVDPPHRLDAIRARTTRPGRARRWTWVAAAGGTLVAASVVAAVLLGHDANPPDVAADNRPSQPANTASDDPTSSSPSATSVRTHAKALYFIGDTPNGPRLFREFQQVPDDYRRHGADLVFNSTVAALATPTDPDYRTEVSDRTRISAQVVEGEIRVFFSHGPRPSSIALQQLRYTLDAASGGLPITWYPKSGNAFTVEADPDLLSDVSISDPTEGRTVVDTFTARGVARSFEATVPWTITDADDTVVNGGFATAQDGISLSPWKIRIDVSDLDPGTYTFTASTDDPSGGEGPGPTTDTRTIVVE